jgi:mono/diheme cytochrome c family protein
MKPFIVLVLVVIAGALVLLYSGAYNVSTANHDNSVMNWAMDNGMVHSVKAHAKGITVPALTDSTMIETGFRHYDEMCVGCHGAPGVTHGDIAEGLWPEAPNLAETASEWTPAQLYWIIKNGLKFTSMPAWGPSHSEKELWAMTAFVQRLPHTTAADYKAMRDKAAKEPGMVMTHP